MKSRLLLLVITLLSGTIKAQTLTNSNLPIVVIDTDINSKTGKPNEILDNPKILATMKIIYRPDGSRNYITDQNTPDFLNYSGRIGIESRGSTSQDLDKKSYGLRTLANDNKSNNNVSILGMPKENDWILNALAFDPSLIRDYLTYDLSRNINNYASRGHFCEVIINGDYRGVYVMMEKLKIDANRINILKMTDTDSLAPNVTGGYITKCDKITGGDKIAWSDSTNAIYWVDFIHESPEAFDVNPQQNRYIYNYFKAFQKALSDKNESVTNGFPTFIDIPSFIDFMIINEISSNVDAYQYSTFFHKDRNGKLRAGPIWDANLTYGNDLFFWGFDRSQTDVWQFDNGDNVGATFWKELFDNQTFKCYLSKRWNDVSSSNKPLNYTTIEKKIDSLVILLAEARIRENTRWKTIDDYQTAIEHLKTWLKERIEWLNIQLKVNPNCLSPTIPALVISKIHYHPLESIKYTSEDAEFIEITNNSDVNISLSGYYFKELGISYAFPNDAIVQARDKIFLASNATTFEKIYGYKPLGEFTRNLSNKSQTLVLADAYGNIIDEVSYTDNAPWPSEADGKGPYLTLLNLDSDNSLPSNWTFSKGVIDSHETSHELTTRIYPIPSSDEIVIENSLFLISGYEIYDISGKKKISNSSVLSNLVRVSIDNLPSGIYVMKTFFRNNISIQTKIVRQ